MNEIISVTLYAEVIRKDYGQIVCRDVENGQEVTLLGNAVDLRITSADTFHKIEKVSRTEMAKLLVDVGQDVFTVTFIKQDGSARTLRGVLVHDESILGRVFVKDLDIPNETNNYRQVDLRTIKELVYKSTKYVLK